MKLLGLLGGLLLCTALEGLGARPNVLLILSDDQGSLDLGCYGAGDLKTPHLDALARRGVRFTRFHTASPVCSPSRVALLTGRHPIRAGLNTNAPSQPGLPGMPPGEITLAEWLRAAGYATGLVGKWHLGTIPECEPNGQGFDFFFGHKSGCIDNYSHFFYWQEPHWHDLWRNSREVWEEGRHSSDLMAREAIRFIQEHRKRPWFLYLSLNVPHYPMQAPERFRAMYTHLPEPRRSYAASISAMDDLVGRVLGAVDRHRLREKTLVIFLSDHGHSTEARANFGGGFAGEFRGSKFTLLEGGLRVPCIASWPGRIPAGETRSQWAVSLDWFPTIADLAGLRLPERILDGRSLRGVLQSSTAPDPHPRMHWKLGDQWAAREGDWKLIVNGLDTRQGTRLPDRHFLVNLAEDPSESTNRAGDHPDLVQRLTRSYESWLEGVSAR